jgi:hypothetical protein
MGAPMSEQYFIVMKCLHNVKSADMPSFKKVRLQIQFLHLLRLLTETDLGDDNTRPDNCTNIAFRTISDLSAKIGESKQDPLLINELLVRLGAMITALSMKSNRSLPNLFLTGSFQVE